MAVADMLVPTVASIVHDCHWCQILIILGGRHDIFIRLHPWYVLVVSWGEEGEEIPCSTSHSILSTAKILIGCTRNRSCHLSVSMDVIYKGFD